MAIRVSFQSRSPGLRMGLAAVFSMASACHAGGGPSTQPTGLDSSLCPGARRFASSMESIFVVDPRGALHCIGRSNQESFECPGLPGPVAGVAVTEAEACVLLEDRRIFCWGDANHNVGVAAVCDWHGPVARLVSDDAVMLGSYDEHFCALDDRGAVSCWGWSVDANQAAEADAELDYACTPVAIGATRGLGCADVTQIEHLCWTGQDQIICNVLRPDRAGPFGLETIAVSHAEDLSLVGTLGWTVCAQSRSERSGATTCCDILSGQCGVTAVEERVSVLIAHDDALVGLGAVRPICLATPREEPAGPCSVEPSLVDVIYGCRVLANPSRASCEYVDERTTADSAVRFEVDEWGAVARTTEAGPAD